MGFFDDLAMGLGFKERTQDYDARTAKTIAAQDAYKSSGGSEAQKAHAMLMARKNFDVNNATGNARTFLDRAGARGGYSPGAYRPAVAQDDRPFMQRLFTSPQGPASPNPYAIGPASFSKPLPMPGLLGILGYASGLLGPKEPGTVSAPEGPMRVRPAGYTPPPAQVAPLQGTAGTYTAAYEPKVPDIRLRQAAGTYTAPYAVSASLLDDYDYLMDDDMTAAVGLAQETSDAPASTPDPEYEAFVEAAKQDPMYVGIVDNPEAMRNIYNMYKEQMGQ